MGNIFRWDSPFAQKLAMVGNSILLNVLWLLCSLPVVTMGASTAALYYVVFQYQTSDETAVIKPFFRAFIKDFKQATLLWIPTLAIITLLILDLRYLFAYGGNSLMWVVVIVASVVFLMIQTQLLPQVARFENKLGTIIKNAALLTILHMPSAFLMATLNILPVVIFLLLPVEFMRWLPLWVGIYFALVAYMNGRMLLKQWAKHIPPEVDEGEENEEQ
ncbi:MAG: DUF624 domain-containing protein [Ruminococcaceae bacterium]|nr:DUF624 domain-containing protein [Oscillospiraceae bacterium]